MLNSNKGQLNSGVAGVKNNNQNISTYDFDRDLGEFVKNIQIKTYFPEYENFFLFKWMEKAIDIIFIDHIEIFKILFLGYLIGVFYIVLQNIWSVDYKKNSSIFNNKLMSLFEYILIFIIFITILLGFIYFIFTINKFLNIKTTLVVIDTILLISLIVQLPIIFILKISVFIFNNIKGSLNKPKILQVMEDFIGILTYTIRYYLQIIRWILTLTSLFLLYEYFFSLYALKIAKTAYQQPITLTDRVLELFRLLFEYFDFLFILSLQLMAFFLVVFWLLPFLFSTLTIGIFEMNKKITNYFNKNDKK